MNWRTNEISGILVKDILHRIVNHRHQWNNRRKGDQHKHRQYQQPSAIILHFIHG
jgi:hypothetical protein